MPEPTKKRGVPRGGRRWVFRQGEAGSRVGLYARVSTHDQQTLVWRLDHWGRSLVDLVATL